MITSYLEREVELGRLEAKNCEVLAQTFVGALWHYAFLQVTMGEVHKKPLSPSQYVEGVVRLLMTGIAPKSKANK
jgi:hypothetical protein